MNPLNQRLMTIRTIPIKINRFLNVGISCAVLLSILFIVSCSRMNSPKDIIFDETRPGHYSSSFDYDPARADSFWASMTLIKSGISPTMMNSDIVIKIRHIEGGAFEFRKNQTPYALLKNEEIVIYKGDFRSADNDSKSTFLSYTSDRKSSFEVIIESKVSKQIVAVRWAYASGG